MRNITLNNLDLQDSTYVTTSIKIEPVSTEQSKLKIPHRDGEKLVSSVYSSRPITIEGYIKSTSSDALDQAIDALKLYCIGQMDVNLDIDYAGATRRFKVNSNNLAIARESYTIDFVPFVISLEAVNPPFGMDTSATEAFSDTALTGTWYAELLASIIEQEITLAGTAEPKPVITLTATTAGTINTIIVENTTTNTALTIDTDGIADDDVFELDTDNQTIKKNDTVITSRRGVFPTFQVGANDLKITAYADSADFEYSLDVNYTKYYL